jgi:hypothetical protein
VLLVGLGVLLLLSNLGLLPPDAWREVFRFWPVLLMLLGLELLLTGRASWGAVVLTLLVVFLLAGFFAVRGWTSFVGGGFGGGPGFVGPVFRGIAGSVAGSFDQAVEGAREAEIVLQFGATGLDVEGGAPVGLLAQVSAPTDGAHVSHSYQVQDGVGRLQVQAAGGPFPGALVNDAPVVVRLSHEVPIRRVEIRGGGSQGVFNLSDLQVRNIDLQAGGGRIILQVPSHGDVSAQLQAGASALVIQIPVGVAADIHVEGGASLLQVNELRFPRVAQPGGGSNPAFQGEFRSSDFGQSPNRVDLRIQSGGSTVEVR